MSKKNFKEEEEGSKFILSPKKPNSHNTKQEPVPIPISKKRRAFDNPSQNKSPNKKQKINAETIVKAEVIKNELSNNKKQQGSKQKGGKYVRSLKKPSINPNSGLGGGGR